MAGKGGKLILSSPRDTVFHDSRPSGDAGAPRTADVAPRGVIDRAETEIGGGTRIFFCGDVHGHFEHIIEAVRQHTPVAIVLLGDVQARMPLEQELAPILDKTEVWFIHGNHDTDTDEDYDNLFGSALANRNLHGKVVNIAGVRIGGLGGVFRGTVWAPPGSQLYASPEAYVAACGKSNLWRGGLPRKHRSSIFPQDYFRLAALRADVMVTNEAPSAHPHGFKAIDALARNMKVMGIFHGHHHDSLDYSEHRAKFGFDAYGVGFRGITDLHGGVVRVGDYDGIKKTWGDYGNS